MIKNLSKLKNRYRKSEPGNEKIRSIKPTQSILHACSHDKTVLKMCSKLINLIYVFVKSIAYFSTSNNLSLLRPPPPGFGQRLPFAPGMVRGAPPRMMRGVAPSANPQGIGHAAPSMMVPFAHMRPQL